MVEDNIIKEYFPMIVLAEIPELTSYLLHNNSILLKNSLHTEQLLWKVYDELENFKIKNNLLYINEGDLKKNIPLESHTIYFVNPVSGLLEKAEIVKNLTFDPTVSGIYELRIDSKISIIRILIFPYTLTNNIIQVPFICQTYVFDKINLSNKDSNRLTNSLRDSTYRIKNQFTNEESLKSYLVQ